MYMTIQKSPQNSGEYALNRMHAVSRQSHKSCYCADVESGVWRVGKRYIGMSVADTTTEVVSRDACMNLCKNTPGCNAATFTTSTTMCWPPNITEGVETDTKYYEDNSAHDSIKICGPEETGGLQHKRRNYSIQHRTVGALTLTLSPCQIPCDEVVAACGRIVIMFRHCLHVTSPVHSILKCISPHWQCFLFCRDRMWRVAGRQDVLRGGGNA